VIIATVVSFAAKLKDSPIKLPIVDNIATGCVVFSFCVCVCVCVCVHAFIVECRLMII